MKQRIFSHNPSTQGFSIALSAKLIMFLLCICKNTLLMPSLSCLFGSLRKAFSDEVAEFADKLSPLALNKRFEKKRILGAKLTFYYEYE